MKKFLNLATLILCLLLPVMQSCSTIFNSGPQAIAVSADGDAKHVSVEAVTPDGSYTGKLPAILVTYPSSFKKTTITVKNKCYEETVVSVEEKVKPYFWANFLWLFGFPIAMGVDYFDGMMWQMDEQIVVPVSKISGCKK